MAADPYLDDDRCVWRLANEWMKHGSLIIAYDFDNTVYDYHNQGHTYDTVIQLLRECKEAGAFLMVFTASAKETYPTIISHLKEKNIPFDSINEQPPNLPFGSESKPYFNILLDDRAGLYSAYTSLKKALERVRWLRYEENSVR